MRNSTSKVGLEIIPGYTLRKRIGAGGYGEVWLADAPGGLQKAVKLVFGTIDESQASCELKSLQRIKEVSHPFLLSLERIEVIDNQLVIVTELAESSVYDKYMSFRRNGNTGIPRKLLLEYLRDSADGLDFLAQKHSLQHLDVKPGNFLLIADRVKVADFGLIKDLQDQSQSLVSGLTPAYSAPEIFDGRPDFRSDQYSLAIVFMEMLTGKMPFSGSTTGELARQHLTKQPELEALPPADRPIVGRAMSKNPLDRFSTCRQFVEQLQRVRASAIPVLENSEPRNPNSQSLRSDSSRQTFTLQCETSFEEASFAAAVDAREVTSSYLTPRSFYIGLGGMGNTALHVLRNKVFENCDGRLSADDHAWLAIDTVSSSLENVTDAAQAGRLSSKQTVQIPIYKPIDYRDADPELLQPISRRWLYNIPKSGETEGVRPLAILAFLDHYEALKEKLTKDLDDLIRKHEDDSDCHEPLRIYLLASLHGGTGSGLVSELAMLIRRILYELNFTNYRICANLIWSSTIANSPACMASAAALACFTEIVHLMDPDNATPSIYFREQNQIMNARPFDWVTVSDGGLHGSANDAEQAAQRLADMIFVDSQTASSTLLDLERANDKMKPLGWLRTAEAQSFQFFDHIDRESLAKLSVMQAVFDSRDYLLGTQKPSQEVQATVSPTASGEIPLTNQASEEFTKRLLKALGLSTDSDLELIDDPEQKKVMLATWARRLTSQKQLVEQQLGQDLKLWRNSIQSVVEMRMYNWKQIERIQLNVIEGILNYCDNRTESLVAYFQQFSDLLGPPEQLNAAAVRYLRRFAQECLELLRKFQSDGKALAKRVEAWSISLCAESNLDRKTLENRVHRLPSEIRNLFQGVCRRVSKAIHDDAARIVSALLQEEPGNLIVPKSVSSKSDQNLNSLLKLSRDLTERTAANMHVEFEKYSADEDVDSIELSADELRRFLPHFAGFGSTVHRHTVVTEDQQEILKGLLHEQRIRKTTSVLPVPLSVGNYMACETQLQGFSHALSATCKPSPKTIQLAERLLTRVDIDWIRVASLFEMVPINPVNTGQALESPLATAASPMQSPSFQSN